MVLLILKRNMTDLLYPKDSVLPFPVFSWDGIFEERSVESRYVTNFYIITYRDRFVSNFYAIDICKTN